MSRLTYQLANLLLQSLKPEAEKAPTLHQNRINLTIPPPEMVFSKKTQQEAMCDFVVKRSIGTG